MDTWRYTAISVTKYDPLVERDYRIAVPPEEWTSYFDVGKKFNGIELTRDEYLATEQNYINAVSLVLNPNSCHQVVVRELEKYSAEGLSGELLELYETIGDSYMVNLEKVPMLMRLILREYMWCEMHCAVNDICVRFGYDYYMYVNGLGKGDAIWQEIADKTGLFIG